VNKVIKIDDDHRIYLYKTRIIYKEKRGGRLITRFVGVSISGLLSSPLIADNVKKKMKEMLKDLS
jgi:hypothetical protein